MAEIHINDQISSNSVPKVKQSPKISSIPVLFFYAPSDDGIDENLLILFHGFGDTHAPFSKLGRQLKLPQTAVLALCAPEQVPFLYEESYQWYQSFNDLGEPIERPNPTPALDLLSKVIDHLTGHCQWPLNRIHFFGFAQGGSVAAEFGIQCWKRQIQRPKALLSPESSGVHIEPLSLGSIVTISGPLLSYPTVSSLCPTPVLVAHRPAPAEIALQPGALKDFSKAYQMVTESKMGSRGGMPASKEEWEPIMRFWSGKLGIRQPDGLYEVRSGQTT